MGVRQRVRQDIRQTMSKWKLASDTGNKTIREAGSKTGIKARNETGRK